MPILFVVATCIGVATLAYVNGSNDISKGIATLVGSGVTPYKRAILWGTVWTVAGSLAAAAYSGSLVKTFSAGFVSSQFEVTHAFILAVLIGTNGWVAFSTSTGLPVSTTHAITGALCGTAVVAFGLHGVAWMAVTRKVFIPLVFSPLVALVMLWVLFPGMRFLLRPLSKRCACAEIGSRSLVPASPWSQAAALDAGVPALRLVVTHSKNCEARSTMIAGISLDDGLHWFSSGLTSFSRGLNDAPKIVALGWPLALIFHDSPTFPFFLVAAGIALGSLAAGLRVTRTMAEKVTSMDTSEGLSANLITSFLVVFASRWGLPVSTTHVSSGAILGVGLRRSKNSVHWNTVRAMLQAWIVTLPVSSALAILGWWMMRGIFKIL